MRALLVIDMPEGCGKCRLADFGECRGSKSYIHMPIKGRPKECPLRPLPCKKYMRQMPSDVLEKDKRKRDFIIHKVDVDNSYAEGWNDCIDAITGETE